MLTTRDIKHRGRRPAARPSSPKSSGPAKEGIGPRFTSSFLPHTSVLVFFVLFVSFVDQFLCFPVRGAEFLQALHPRDWSFPRDHGRHDGFKTEWWYFTGNMHDAGGREFGYQLTFFRTAFTAQPTTRASPWAMTDLYFAHAAISDVSGKTFIFKDRLERGRPRLAWASDNSLDVVLLDWSAQMKDHTIDLRANEPGFKIDLTCGADRGPVLQGPGGVNFKGRQPGQASYYYSVTRLPTAGSLTINDHKYQVTGLSWMDHEFSSNSLSAEQSGWDWMGLQLSDGTDLMIYRLRNKTGTTDYLSGTRVTPDGKPHYLAAGDIQMIGSHDWTSPQSGGVYPQQWTVKVAGLPDLLVTSAMPGQELITSASTKVTYFEGVAHVTDLQGHPIGAGYLEMTGYSKSRDASSRSSSTTGT
jgi:predicted secreted hydrolase